MDREMTKAEKAIYKLSEISKLVFALNKMGRESGLQGGDAGGRDAGDGPGRVAEDAERRGSNLSSDSDSRQI